MQGTFITPVTLRVEKTNTGERILATGSEEFFLVAAPGAKLGDEGIEEGRVCGGIGGPEVVDRIDDADAEQIPPDPVDSGAVEEGVVVDGEPVDERHARIVAGGDLERRAKQRRWRKDYP